MPSVTVALEDDGLLHLRLPVTVSAVTGNAATVGGTAGTLVGLHFGGEGAVAVVRLDQPHPVPDPDDHGPAEAVQAPHHAPTAWTDAQVRAAARALWGMGWDACIHPNWRKERYADVRRALNAALAAGPMPARVETVADDEALVEELMPLLINAYSGNPGGYGAEARAALAWMRQHPDPATVALVRAARLHAQSLRDGAAPNAARHLEDVLAPFAGVGEGGE